jgi:hypothetical protein
LSDFDSYARKHSVDNGLNHYTHEPRYIAKNDDSDNTVTSNRMPFSPIDRTIKHFKYEKHNKDKHKIVHVDKYASIFYS